MVTTFFHDDDPLTRPHRAFDEPIGAVPLGFLAHQKAGNLLAADAGHRDHRRRDRVGPDRHSADRLGQRQIVGEQVENPFGHQLGAERIERHLLAVEIVFGLLATGQGEIAELERPVANQFDQGAFVVHGKLQ